MKYFVLLMSLGITACSNNPNQDTDEYNAGKNKVPQEYFSTHIREDGGKEFSLTLSFSKPSKAMLQKRRSRLGGDKQQKRTANGRADRAQAMLDKLEPRLEQRLAENQFCQQGYEIIDRTFNRGQISIRGECVESADSVPQENPAV